MNRFSHKQQNGFTIIELMIAAVISLLLLGAFSQIFLGNKESYHLLEASAHAQENGRFGMEFLSRDIRMVGYMGCANINTVNFKNNVDPADNSNDVDNTVGAFDGTNGIRGLRYPDGGPFPADAADYGLTAADVVQGTDILLVQRAEGCAGGDVIASNNTSAQYTIADNSVCQVQQGDVILVSDCQNADIHGVSNVVNGAGTSVNITHGANRNLTPQLSNSYGPGSGIYKMSAMVYYIGYGASGEPALFRRRLTGQNLVPEELLESVYDMEILYGLNTDADNVANRYVTADNVANWENVLTASVTLFTRSLDDGLTENPVTYSFNGANVTDNRLLRDFSFTTTIRNRQP